MLTWKDVRRRFFHRCRGAGPSRCAHVILLLCGLISFSFSFPPDCSGSEQIIIKVVLNSEDRGEFFAVMTGDGDFFLAVEDLKGMGFTDIRGITGEFDGRMYVSLRSMEGVEYGFDEKNLTLQIVAAPTLLSRFTLDFGPKRAAGVFYPEHSSAFLNYSLNYSDGDIPEYPDLTLTNQVGIRSGGVLFLTDSIYTRNRTDDRFLRLMTAFTYDRRDEMDRFVAGDFFAGSGLLGSSVNMGGFGYSKVYTIDPYFIRYPTLDVTGLVSMPSEIEVYLDNIRIETEKIPSGEFELKNIYYYGGARDVEVILRDPFGNERRLKYPFYFTDRLLKQGLHEFSYNLGFLREDFGVKSNRYTSLALVAFHRYGFKDALTGGLRVEAMDGLYNLGAEATALLGTMGTATFALAGSLLNGEEGLAGSFEWLYETRNLNARIFINRYTEDYTTVGNRLATEKRSYEAAAGVSYGNIELGTLALDIGTSRTFGNNERRTAMVTYTRSLTRKSTVFATYRRIKTDEPGDEFFVGINYYPWRDSYITTQYRRTEESNTELVQFQKNTPFGEGLGVRGTYDRTGKGGDYTRTLSSTVQYNSRRAIVRAHYSGQESPRDSKDIYQLSVAGSLAYVGDTLMASRPINDSFALVKVGDVQGVRVYMNNQEVGKTDSRGMVLIPDVGSYYDNRISIDDRDIPIEYSIDVVEKAVSPPLRSGSCVEFRTSRFQAMTGRLMVKIGDELKPLEFHSAAMSNGEKTVDFVTGRGGEFYIEELQRQDASLQAVDERECRFAEPVEDGAPVQGRYDITYSYMGKQCTSEILVPDTEDLIVDLGEVVCEPPGAEKVPEEAPEFPDILFDVDSFDVRPEYSKILEEAAELLLEDRELRITLEGHCDETGSAEYNKELAAKRALAVRDYLVGAGVQADRIIIESYGKERPLCREDTEECRQMNRRVHIRLDR